MRKTQWILVHQEHGALQWLESAGMLFHSSSMSIYHDARKMSDGATIFETLAAARRAYSTDYHTREREWDEEQRRESFAAHYARWHAKIRLQRVSTFPR